MKMSENEMDKIVELFFEFLKHMEDVTDVMDAMARKMKEMDLRIKTLENKPRKKYGESDDTKWDPRLA